MGLAGNPDMHFITRCLSRPEFHSTRIQCHQTPGRLVFRAKARTYLPRFHRRASETPDRPATGNILLCSLNVKDLGSRIGQSKRRMAFPSQISWTRQSTVSRQCLCIASPPFRCSNNLPDVLSAYIFGMAPAKNFQQIFVRTNSSTCRIKSLDRSFKGETKTSTVYSISTIFLDQSNCQL